MRAIRSQGIGATGGSFVVTISSDGPSDKRSVGCGQAATDAHSMTTVQARYRPERRDRMCYLSPGLASCALHLTLYKQQEDDYGMAAAERYLDRVVQSKGELDWAQALFTSGLDKAQHFKAYPSDFTLQGHLLVALANLAEAQGQYDEAQLQGGT